MKSCVWLLVFRSLIRIFVIEKLSFEMNRLLYILILSCFTPLLNARDKHLDAWQEIDSLIAQGHYATAYEKGGQQLRKAKRKGDGHSMLKAVYKQRVAAAAYQENHVEESIEAYQSIIPSLKGADKSIAYMLLGAVDEPKRTYYEAALAESKALKAVRAEDYDLLVEGDTLGLRLQPTLYDVVMHALIEGFYMGNVAKFPTLYEQRQLLMGTAEEFAQLILPVDTASYTLWQLGQLQTLTRHHLRTSDAALRAHIDRKRMERLRLYTPSDTWNKAYVDGLERIAASYAGSPTEEAIFLYMLAKHFAPEISVYTSRDKVDQEVVRARKMEEYIQRIHEIAPDSEWDAMAKALYESVTNSYLSLQKHTVALPGQECGITLTVRNAGDVLYRIVPRYVGEHNENFVFKEVIGRRSVGKPYYKADINPSDSYTFEKVTLTLPPLDAGDYFVIATNNGQTPETKRSSITAISVTNLKMSMMCNEAEAEYIGMVLDATTGQTVLDCEVALMENSGNQTHLLERYFPDEKGYFVIPLPSGRYRNLYLRASDGLSHTTYKFRYDDFAEHRYWESDEADASTLFTFLHDRYTYEPGDTVHFGIIAYSHSEEGSRVKDYLPIGLTLMDGRRKEMGTLQGITDEWGCYNGCFALPKDATPGRFRLHVTDSISGRTMYHTINVESYKAPTFTAEIERPTGVVRLGDSLTLQGTATTYTGLPVIGAKVRYEVTTGSGDVFGYQPLDGTLECALSDTTFTDEMGHFSITFKAGDLNASNEDVTCNYTINTHITDLSGEVQSTRTSVIVGKRTKHTNLPNWKGMVMHGDSIIYSLLTLNGQRIAEPVTLTLSRLEVPQYMGIRASGENDWEEWSVERTLINRCEQSALGSDNALVITPDMPCGTYRLTMTYTDGGKTYSEHCYFKLWGEGKSTESSYALFTMATRGYKVSTGDTAVFYIGTRHSDVYTHYYIKVEDRVVDKGTLCLTDETVALRIPIKEQWRGRMAVSIASVKENVKYTSTNILAIEDKASQLNVQLSTLRNHLVPGDKEQCTIRVSDYWGNPVRAALTLSVYDAALDAYGRNYWDIALAPQRIGRAIRIDEDRQSAWTDHSYISIPQPTQPKYYTLPGIQRHVDEIFCSLAAPATTRGQAKNRAGFDVYVAEALVVNDDSKSSTSTQEPEEAYIRQDLRHTALFLPTLRTDEQGRATFTLTAPDLLTRWHVKGMAHTKDLKHGRLSVDFITRKELMVQPHVPRFLYEGDACDFTAKVTNSSDKPMTVTVRFEATSLNASEQTLAIEAGGSVAASFAINVPQGLSSLTYRITAQSDTHRDGEQGIITILPRRTLVTETMALYLNGKEKREFVFEALKGRHSETLEHHSLKLDMVSNPMWYVIEALPPLCEESNPSYEQLFHRYYAASLGLKLMAQYPEIAGYCDFYQRDSLLALQQTLLSRLSVGQHTDGGWPWMEGFGCNAYITQLIIKGMGELESMGCVAIAQDETLYAMLKKAVTYLDRVYQDRFDRMERKPKTLASDALHYLYARAMFPELPFEGGSRIAYEHYKDLLLKDKATRGTLQHKAQKMLTLIRMGESSRALKVAKVVQESSLKNDEMGIYWRDNSYGYSSNPISTQALLVEAFVQLHQPTDIIARMQQWLLKQKQTTHWGSTLATAQALHALVLASPTQGLPSSAEGVKVKVGGKTVDALLDDTIRDKRLGVIQQEWTPEEIRPSLATVSLEQQAETPAWGSMTWQYYEEIDKVDASCTGLTLTATYYKVENSGGRESLTELQATSLSKGDRIRVQLTFSADRAMDYVELHMHRPAALEPSTTRSGYTYSKGLGYYRSIENTRNVYYLQHIEKGSHTIECDFWVSQAGSYSCAPSTIQCMYAPTFMATSETIHIGVLER